MGEVTLVGGGVLESGFFLEGEGLSVLDFVIFLAALGGGVSGVFLMTMGSSS